VHPAMREMTRHAARPYEASRARLIVLILTSFTAPLLLILQGHNDTRDSVIAASAALLWLLAQARLWGLNISQLRTLTWERALTAAGPTRCGRPRTPYPGRVLGTRPFSPRALAVSCTS
jgi:hypothetical protein